MTKQEAVEILQDKAYLFHGEEVKALSMAIEALEQKQEVIYECLDYLGEVHKNYSCYPFCGITEQERLPKHCIVPSGDYVATAGVPKLPKRGKWVDVSERGSWSIKNACDQCGEMVFQPNYNYCPNCGARMEGSEE